VEWKLRWRVEEGGGEAKEGEKKSRDCDRKKDLKAELITRSRIH
jgi:hypothetical protein